MGNSHPAVYITTPLVTGDANTSHSMTPVDSILESEAEIMIPGGLTPKVRIYVPFPLSPFPLSPTLELTKQRATPFFAQSQPIA